MRIIGLISGTSIDAIDAALVEIEREQQTLHLAVRAFRMWPWDEALRERLRGLMPPNVGSTAAVCELNVLAGEAFADAACRLAEDAGVPIESVDLIASHGQTVYHQVAPGTTRSTLQLGAAAIMAERTGCTVAADFRLRDMAAGGEGAPLVPYLDLLLLRDRHKRRAAQNIGGIGNVTFVPPTGDVVAFDTGPGNVLIDEAVRLLTGGTQTFDRGGLIAAAGTVDSDLLEAWMLHPYFRLPIPKSTGRELFGAAEAREYVRQARERGLADADSVATLTALTARSIAQAYRDFLPALDEALIGGGGARNATLMRMLAEALPGVAVRTMDDVGLDADAKEAVAFALLGYAALHGWPGNVQAATGAARPVILGSITPGLNYRRLLVNVLAAPAEVPFAVKL